MNRVLILSLCAVFSLWFMACSKSQPAGVAASVNGRNITTSELDHQYATQFMNPSQKTSSDQDALQKLELLRSLIDNEILFQSAEKQGLLATDADVDQRLNEMKAPYTQEQFQQQLASRKMTMDELKTQLRRELSISKLLNKEVASRISVSDKDIEGFYRSNQAAFNLPEPQIHLAQILVSPVPGTKVMNLKNDKAQNEDQAQKKIIMIHQRLRAGEDFAMLAQNYSEDPNTASTGGDMGFIPESAFDQSNSELRQKVFGIPPGQFSEILTTREGLRILKVFSREPAGQRDLKDPRVQQSIRETLMGRREALLKAAFYESVRNDARVVNYLASSISGAAQ
jgi:peptidyl-prolyl cis-trans isomerase SurA